MQINMWRPLNIRQKIIISLVLYGIAIAAVGTVSYTELKTINRKLEIVEMADNLNNVILEIRRYEKNYLLYNEPVSLEENRRYIEIALNHVENIGFRIRHLRGEPQLYILRRAINEYRSLMDLLAALPEGLKSPEASGLVEQVRIKGQNMLELTEKEVAFERRMIHNILGSLRLQLIFAVTAALALGAILPVFMLVKIFKPLKQVQKATELIAAGKFEEIPVSQTRDEMQRMMEAFNHMVKELERRQEQLIQTQKLSSMGTLTAGVAHQLNNPLNNISTSCQIAQEELESGDSALLNRMLGNINQETMRARDIVKGLLEFSRAQVFTTREVSLLEVVDRTIQLVSSQVPARIEISRDIPDSLFLTMDAQRMQEVLLNLLLNAVQSIGDRPGAVRIRASEDKASESAVIIIEDTGPGIPREIQDQIFDPFFTTKKVGQGTGLGLSIVYGIIKQHRGSITAGNASVKGARFEIRLPLRGPGKAGE